MHVRNFLTTSPARLPTRHGLQARLSGHQAKPTIGRSSKVSVKRVSWHARGFCNDQGGKAMLVLTRRIGEEIVIDKQIRVVVTEIEGCRVRLGIRAPDTVRVDRLEVHERRSFSPSLETAGIEGNQPS